MTDHRPRILDTMTAPMELIRYRPDGRRQQLAPCPRCGQQVGVWLHIEGVSADMTVTPWIQCALCAFDGPVPTPPPDAPPPPRKGKGPRR